MSDIVKLISDSFIKEAKGSPVLFNDLANLEKYISESYSGRSLIELLQNADDAGAKRFYLKKLDELRFAVANDGRIFTEGGQNRLDTLNINYSAKLGKGIYLAQNVDIRSEVEIGDYSYCSAGTIVFSKVKIGSYCSIGYNVQIGLPEHPLDHISTSPSVYRSRKLSDTHRAVWPEDDFPNPPIIGDDVWIGSNVCILQGVHIGNGAVIAAGAVVTKDVAAYAVVGGVPAKIIKYRFNERQRKRIIESQWWKKDLSWLEDNYENIMEENSI